MRLKSALLYDVKLQFRHGLYYVYTLISLTYIVLLYQLHEEWRETAGTLLTFSDPGVLGLFFVGGLVLLEKIQNIYDNLFVTPYTIDEYLCSKTLSLTCLSVLSSYVIHASVFGLHWNSVLFILGTALTSIFFTILGIGLAVRCQTLNGFFLSSTVYLTVFCVPLAETSGFWSSPWLNLLPTKASLLLIGSAFTPLTGPELLYSLTILPASIILAYLWTRRSFQRYILLKTGGVKPS